MTGNLSIDVRGSSGSCRRAADWFRTMSEQAMEAGQSASHALRSANSGWWGPASAQFQSQVKEPRNSCDDLSHTCSTAETALLNFADGLDKVNERIDQAVDTARAGGLDVTDLEIVAPEKSSIITLSKPQLPSDGKHASFEAYGEAAEKYNAQVDAYNRKVAVFNECSTLVKEARVLEDQIHVDLEAELPKTDPTAYGSGRGAQFDGWKVGSKAVSTVLSGFEAATTPTSEKKRAAALKLAGENDLLAQTYTQLATAKRYADFNPTPEQREALTRTAQESGLARDRQLALVRMYERGMPAPFRSKEKWVALETPARRAAAVSVRDGYKSTKLTKALGTASIVVAVGTEIGNLVRGDQTVGGTIVKSIGAVAAGTIGIPAGVIGGTAAGAGGNPFTAIAGGIAVSTIVGEIVDKGIEVAMPRDFDVHHNQAWAEAEQKAPPL